MIIEGDELLMNPSSMRGAVSRSRAWGMTAVMNPSVADIKRYKSQYDATDEVNGVQKQVIMDLWREGLMRPGISLWTIGTTQDEGLISAIRAGFEDVELWADPLNYLLDSLDDILKSVRDQEVSVWSVHAPFTGVDISSPDAIIRSKSLDMMKVTLEIASKVEAHYVVVHPSEKAYDDKKMYREAVRSLIRSLEELVKQAERYGVRLVLENMLSKPGKFRIGTSIKALKSLIEENGLDVGICLDTGHSHHNGLRVDEEVIEANGLLRTLHVNDNHGTMDEHLVPGEGTIDWNRFISSLSRVDDLEVLLLEVNTMNSEEILKRAYQAGMSLCRRIMSMKSS